MENRLEISLPNSGRLVAKLSNGDTYNSIDLFHEGKNGIISAVGFFEYERISGADNELPGHGIRAALFTPGDREDPILVVD